MKYRDAAPIIAIDGNHRSGKGTQLDILSNTLRKSGYEPLILRGDGSRTGVGDDAGDPVSAWWQQFKEYTREFDNEYTPWRIGSLRLLAEAAIHLSNMSSHGVILFDRAGISRTQMTLREDLPISLETLYRGHDEFGLTIDDIRRLQPNLTFFLSAPTEVLTDRLDPNDPKYTFRKNNILASNEYFEQAYGEYKRLGLGAIERIVVDNTVESIAEQIKNGTISQL